MVFELILRRGSEVRDPPVKFLAKKGLRNYTFQEPVVERTYQTRVWATSLLPEDKTPMARVGQIRGVLLEEAVLLLLEAAGYQAVAQDEQDVTLTREGAGLKVKGRGTSHQIDALAEFAYTLPFVHRQRLVVEGKCRSETTGLSIVRNSVGVWKDISEYWRGDEYATLASRYHYIPAIFSVAAFSDRAQQYAFAHDVFLFSIGNHGFTQPLVSALWNVRGTNFNKPSGRGIELDFEEFRLAVREGLRSADDSLQRDAWDLSEFRAACRKVSAATIAMAAGTFPIFLVPRSRDVLHDIESEMLMRIRRSEGGWYIEANGERLFSFDLPQRLFQLYAEEGQLEDDAALRMKREKLHTLDLVVSTGTSARLVQLRLDRGWIRQLETEL